MLTLRGAVSDFDTCLISFAMVTKEQRHRLIRLMMAGIVSAAEVARAIGIRHSAVLRWIEADAVKNARARFAADLIAKEIAKPERRTRATKQSQRRTAAHAKAIWDWRHEHDATERPKELEASPGDSRP